MIIKDVSIAELEVMEQIWLAKGPVTITDIWRLLDEKWTYQTVQTFVNRLHMKGFIDMVGKRVRSFEYVPCVTRSEYLALTKGHLFSDAPGASVTDFISCLYVNGIIHDSDIEQIENWVKEVRA